MYFNAKLTPSYRPGSLFLQHQLADVKQIDDGSGDFNCDIDSQGAESHDMFIQPSIRFLMTLDG